jgi:hypothetical protein
MGKPISKTERHEAETMVSMVLDNLDKSDNREWSKLLTFFSHEKTA